MRSNIEHLHRKLQKRWTPKWHHAFCDTQFGGFHERLGHSFRPVDVGYKRLVTQCRQLAVYAHSSTHKDGQDYRKDLAQRIDFLTNYYPIPDLPGAWAFSTKNDGTMLDSDLDLYGHAFVIFTMCHLYAAMPQDRFATYARQTLDFINISFRLDDAPGFAEALTLDPKTNTYTARHDNLRRQDPHMHLLEACLFAYETWHDTAYRDMADEIMALFATYFCPDGTSLIEFMAHDLTPHQDQGHMVKPGHYFEWVWLIQKYIAITGNDHINGQNLHNISRHFLHKGNSHGYDPIYGGIYDFTDHDGHVIESTKRLWQFAEGLKANAMMLDQWHDRNELKDRVSAMITVFENGYMQERGFWTETLNRDLTDATDYMPGTTPYHLYFGIEETLSYLAARGRSKSWRSVPKGILYNLRRRLSRLTRHLLLRG